MNFRLCKVNSDLASVASHTTLRTIFAGNVTFANGRGDVPFTQLLYNTAYPVYAYSTSNVPLFVSANTLGGFAVCIPISTGYSGDLYVEIYGFGWN